MLQQRWWLRALSMGVCGLTSLILGCVAPSPHAKEAVDFNQHWLEHRWDSSRTHWYQDEHIEQPRPTANDIESVKTRADQLDFTDAGSLLTFILDQLPARSVVYPSEQYFYYQFASGPRLIAGNLRFVEAPTKLWVGYFNRFDQKQVNARPFSVDDGLLMTKTSVASGDICTVSWQGRTREFLIPIAWTHGTQAVRTLPGERLISGTLDESGTAFGLIYTESTNDLFYVLNEAAPRPERYAEVRAGAYRFLVGQESRFIFLRADDRWVLVGVSADEIRRNSYFDGPFDQIPPDLDLKDMLERVYPYVLGMGGIDFNGNFVQMHGQRVAISAYQAYDEAPQDFCTSAAKLLAAKPDAGWRMLTWESKRLLDKGGRPKLPPFPPDYRHDLSLSKEWPANHYPGQSRQRR